jgi:hypothetical protein
MSKWELPNAVSLKFLSDSADVSPSAKPLMLVSPGVKFCVEWSKGFTCAVARIRSGSPVLSCVPTRACIHYFST